eukprot:CAMPEP_0170515606 /NCGR_PEP_ID=MMETSP0209-20121228/2020_1 /TAXON_ID=665100 ORGANISM="Litonotus pictus, Strain P1" /NCGR_SAMPLE_ID=MMETSP0209 /ASSEMBLY_ACC=CAM_ASM_000301 /LENGTH=414 /DNA_ID=CAMNT_0010800173 /DNA_START=923 /DNA_END=2170 /DNA_ORIENTATION=+
MLVISAFILIETPADQLRQEYLKNKRREQLIQHSESYGTISESQHSQLDQESRIGKDDDNSSKYEEIRDQFNLFFSFIKLPIIYKPVVFILLYMATPSYSDPLFYFYTTELKFSPIIMGRLKLVYGIASVIGIFLYNKYLRAISFKRIIWATTLLSIFFNMLTIIVVERLNTYVGIPDLYFCLTTDALTVALAEINTMPLLVLACNLCPKNIEGTLYAFLMSVSNFGALLSNQFGSSLSSLLGITNTNFDNLSWLVFIANIVLLIPMPALYLVDEGAYNTEKLKEKECVDLNDVEARARAKKISKEKEIGIDIIDENGIYRKNCDKEKTGVCSENESVSSISHVESVDTGKCSDFMNNEEMSQTYSTTKWDSMHNRSNGEKVNENGGGEDGRKEEQEDLLEKERRNSQDEEFKK